MSLFKKWCTFWIIFLSSLLTILFLRSASFITNHSNFPSDTLQPVLQNHTRTKDTISDGSGFGIKILLFTSYRSGSTFVGELFKNNPQFFYMFEPFMLLRFHQFKSSKVQRLLIGQNISNFLQDLFHCNLTKFENTSRKYFPWSDSDRKGWLKKLVSPAEKSYATAEKTCKNYRNLAIKSIRIPHLHHIVPSLTRQGIKVINLVRDPRGTLSSRLKMNFVRDPALIKKAAHIHCTRLTENLKYIANQSKTFQEKTNNHKLSNYYLVRYEDIAMNPFSSVQNLYVSLGLTMPENVTSWLKMSTNTADTDVYGTKRISQVTATAWRTNTDWSHVSIIQEQCKDLMSSLGYNSVTHNELTNKSVPVVGNIPTSAAKYVNVLQ